MQFILLVARIHSGLPYPGTGIRLLESRLSVYRFDGVAGLENSVVEASKEEGMEGMA